MNKRQHNNISQQIEFANKFNALYNEAFTLFEQWREEFMTGKENSLDPTDGLVTQDELDVYGLTYDDFNKLMNQAAQALIDFYTNEAVVTREYGKFVRSVMNNLNY